MSLKTISELVKELKDQDTLSNVNPTNKWEIKLNSLDVPYGIQIKYNCLKSLTSYNSEIIEKFQNFAVIINQVLIINRTLLFNLPKPSKFGVFF